MVVWHFRSTKSLWQTSRISQWHDIAVHAQVTEQIRQQGSKQEPRNQGPREQTGKQAREQACKQASQRSSGQRVGLRSSLQGSKRVRMRAGRRARRDPKEQAPLDSMLLLMKAPSNGGPSSMELIWNVLRMELLIQTAMCERGQDRSPRPGSEDKAASRWPKVAGQG